MSHSVRVSAVMFLVTKHPNVLWLTAIKNGLISEFIQYFVSISTKSSSLLREQYADVFEALKTARGPESQEAQEDQLAQMVEEIQEGNTDSEVESEEGEESEDQSRDIDLMASDNEEDEEEIESEN